MRILHYTLGLYPHRTGGLNRYSTDLIREQAKQHQVAVLMPGAWMPFCSRCFISKVRKQDGILCFYLRNALPQPLLFGIKTPDAFVGRHISQTSFERFYEEFKPEVLHLHTLMGIPEDAIRFFKDKGVKIVYTSHDYFGICPKVNFIKPNGELCDGPAPDKCCVCNQQAPSVLFLRLRSSWMALKTRDFVRWIKSINRS